MVRRAILVLVAVTLLVGMGELAVHAGKGGGKGGGGNGGGNGESGPRLSFCGFDGDHWQIHAVNSDGSGREQLTSDADSSNHVHDWSADDRMLVKYSTDGGETGLRTLHVADSNDASTTVEEARFVVNDSFAGARWSAHAENGNVLAAAQQWIAVAPGGYTDELYIVRQDGSDKTDLTGYEALTDYDEVSQDGTRYSIDDVDWLPDGPGNRIRLSYGLQTQVWSSGTITGGGYAFHVVTLDTSDWSSPTVLDWDDPLAGADGITTVELAFSRDGTRVAYEPAGTAIAQIKVAEVTYDAQTGAPTVESDTAWLVADETTDDPRPVFAGSFSPDNLELMYKGTEVDRRGRVLSNIYVTDASTNGTPAAVDGLRKDVTCSQWGP